MKRSLVFILLVSSLSVNSQVRIGLRGGINFAKFVYRPQYSDEKKSSGTYLPRLNVGLLFEIPLNNNDNWFIYTGPYYAGKGNRVRARYRANPFDTIVTYLNYIELPLSVGYKFPAGNSNRLVAVAGPYIAYGFGGKVVYHNSPDRTRQNLHRNDGWYKRIDIGFAVNAMYEIKKRFGMRFDYSRSIVDISKPFYQWKENNNVFDFSLFWYLSKRKEAAE
jgi:hypothetical protein